jgi:Protein of unknown function (DUF2637)
MPDPTPTLTSAPPAMAAARVAVVFTDVVLRRLLFGVILVMTAVVLGVAGAAFFTSFEAIRDFAERSGGIRAEHAWLVPLLVDSFIFIASAADLWFTVTGAARSVDGWAQRTIIWSPKLLLALAASGSFALNIAHAEPTWAARGVAAIPPIALVLTFEILLAVVRRAAAARIARLSVQQDGGASQQQPIAHIAATPAPTALAAATERSALTQPIGTRGERPASISRVSAPGGRGRRSPTAAARVAEVRRLYLEGVTVAEEIARRLELPPSTARRLLTKVKGELAARPTDHGAGARTPTVGERPVDQRPRPPAGERPAGARPLPPDRERHPVDGGHSPAPDGEGERPAEAERDRQPPEQAMLALTRDGVAGR